MKLDTGDLLDQEATRARLAQLLAEDARLTERQAANIAERDALKAEHKAIGDRRGKVSLAVRHCRSELGEAREPRADTGAKRTKQAPAEEPVPATEEVATNGQQK